MRSEFTTDDVGPDDIVRCHYRSEERCIVFETVELIRDGQVIARVHPNMSIDREGD
jgi:hypothetical protein